MINQASGGEIAKNYRIYLETGGLGNDGFKAKFRIPPGLSNIPSLMVNEDTGEQGIAELWESWSAARSSRYLDSWEGSKISHAKKPCLYPALKEGLMTGYNWVIERRWPQSPQKNLGCAAIL